LRLLDQPVDIIIAQAGGDNPGPQCASAGDQFVGLNHDCDAIVRVEAALRQLSGNLAG
jgi:hypothetical protein